MNAQSRRRRSPYLPLGRLNQLFGSGGELRRQGIVLGQQPARVGNQIQFMLAQLGYRIRPFDECLVFVELGQEQRAKLGVKSLRAFLELADCPAELKGENQQTLFLIADRGLREGVSGIGGLLLHLLDRPGSQQAGNQRTDIFPSRLGRLPDSVQQLGEMIELTVVNEQRRAQQPLGFFIGVKHHLHQILDASDQVQPQTDVRVHRREIGIQQSCVAVDRRQLLPVDPAIAQLGQKRA